MRTTRADRNRTFYHYAFWSIVNDFNQAEKDKDKPKFIMTSQARYAGSIIDKRLELNIAKQNQELIASGKEPTAIAARVTAFAKAVNDAFEYFGKDTPISNLERPMSDPVLQKLQDDFKNMTKTQNDIIGPDGILPISPYDPKFANNSSILDGGSYLSGVSGEYEGSVSDLTDRVLAQNIPVLSNVRAVKRYGDYVFEGREVEGAMLLSESDLSGLSRLRRFMSEKTFKDVQQHVNAAFSVENLTDDDMKLRQDSIDRSVAILDALSEMGYEYTIKRDSKLGQLKASIVGTRIDVRILDTPENNQYIGRVYDNGATMTFYNTYRTKDKVSAPEYITPVDSVNLVKYALGEPFVGPDGQEVGQAGSVIKKIRNGFNELNTAYRGTRGFMAYYGTFRDQNGNYDTKYNNRTYININTDSRSMSTTPMLTDSAAAIYLQGAVSSARSNYTSQLDIDRIINDCNDHKGEQDYTPVLSSNIAIAIIQQAYADVLMGRQSDLMRPGQKYEDFEKRLLEGGEFETDTPEAKAIFDAEMRDLIYPSDMSPEDKVRAHAYDSVEYEIGDYVMDSNGKRFNPVGVATYQTSAYSQYRNNDDIIKALQILKISADELKGSEFYNATVKDRLINFNVTQAKPMKNLSSDFMKDMFDTVKDTLSRNGLVVNDDDILIDNNGIVQYQGDLAFAQSVKKGTSRITGYIGQIFEPDTDGVVETKFAGSSNYDFVPGFDAIILPQKLGQNKTMEERTKLIGYAQQLKRSIRYNVRQDIITADKDAPYIGQTTNINRVYRHITGERFELGFRDKFREQKMDESMLSAIIKTQSQRVRYSNSLRDGATIYADYAAKQYGNDMTNDNFGDPYVLTGNTNMAIITENSFGYFDPIATNSTNTTQGLVRFLTNDAKVEKDGFITPGDKNSRCAIMAHEYTKNLDFDPFDRQCMTLSNLMQASSVTNPVNIAQRTCGGWTFDDAIVVSKKFADNYKMRAHDGHMRPLVKGDKLSDFHGNKGVISLVVDPDWTLEEAKEFNLLEPWKLFHNNPDLDVMMAPFPATSRFNGGTSRDLMEDPIDFVEYDGSVVEGGMGKMRMIITDKSADAKTHAYDDSDVAQGKGRRVSSQLAWALNAKGATHLLREFYGNNTSSLSNLREALISCGYDISDTGTFTIGYTPHEGEKRKVMEMPELKYRVTQDGRCFGVNHTEMLKDFAKQIEVSGGIMELPFELKFPSGEPIPPLNDGKTDVVYTKEQWYRKGYVTKTGKVVPGTWCHRHDDAATKRAGDGDVTWGLPVMSAYMRSGQEFEDGTSSTHDYTHAYEDIFKEANKYRDIKNRLEEGGLSQDDVFKLKGDLTNCQIVAQNRFNNITRDISSRMFEGKHNIIKENIMGHRISKSATAIWTPDPRLGIEEVAVSEAVAKTLELKDGDFTLLWRDPILRDSGIRFLKVKIDSSLTGVAINPLMDKPFDGDFDGDTVGLCKISGEKAINEAKALFSVQANMLEQGALAKDGKRDFTFNTSLDCKVVTHHDVGVRAKFDLIRDKLNDIEDSFVSGNLSWHDYMRSNGKCLKEVNSVVQDMFSPGKAYAGLSYKDMQSHISSVYKSCIETGAKGNDKKFANFLHWLGVSCESKPDGSYDFTRMIDVGHTFAKRHEQEETMYATAVKSHGTGLGGGCSQRGMAALRNLEPKAVLEVTYPVTQSLLQVKHDAADARHKYNMLLGPVRDLWKGYKISEDEGEWRCVREDGEPCRTTTEEWIDQFVSFYESPLGLNTPVNKDYVRKVANALTDGDYIVGVEESSSKSPMDILAYGGNIDTIAELASEGANLFEGRWNSQFAPRSIVRNKFINKALESGEEIIGSRVSIGKSDVLEDGKKVKPKVSKVSVDIKHRRQPNVDTDFEETLDINSDYQDFA